jgi:hypothetical protein
MKFFVIPLAGLNALYSEHVSKVTEKVFFNSFISNQNYFRFYKLICCFYIYIYIYIYDSKRLIQ